jgi:DNA modification methylase
MTTAARKTKRPETGLAVALRPVEDLIPYARNARTHSDAHVAQIAGSIREFGWTVPVLLDGANGIIAGHGRVLAARKLGLAAVPCIEVAHLTDLQRRAYILADNKLALNAGWDEEMLGLELAELQAGDFDLSVIGFDDDELAALLAVNTEGLTDPDEVPEAPAEPVSVLGDVWVMGHHRIMCGDTSCDRTVGVLLADKDVDLIVTSPPYNQKIDSFKPSGMHKEGGWVKKVGALAYADNLSEQEYQDWQRDLLRLWFTVLREGASIFYNHKNRYRDKRVVSPMEWLPSPFALRQEIIWSRPGSVTQNARMFLPSDERIYWLYKGDDFTFNDTTEIKSWATVWDVGLSPNKEHAVAFPVELPERCIRAASMPDDLVFEPFCGSGTTLIGAEKTGRRCYGMEKLPAYVDVAVTRWQNFTGQQATLQSDGRTFAKVAASRKS